MITVTGLKTSKLKKGFSLHAKKIWSWSRGSSLKRGMSEYVYRYFHFQISYRNLFRGFPKSLYILSITNARHVTVIM